MYQEMALWATIGLLLSAVGYTITDWQFHCYLATYWALSTLSRWRGRIEGMIDFMEMDDAEQQRLKRVLNKIKEEEL